MMVHDVRMVLSETSRLSSCLLSVVLLPLVLVCFTHPTPVCGIQCYECVHNNQRVRRHDRYVYPCSEFDGSSRYVMDCPDSPYCVYQRITLSLAKDKVHVVTMDGCTPNSTGRGRMGEHVVPFQSLPPHLLASPLIAPLVHTAYLGTRSAYKPETRSPSVTSSPAPDQSSPHLSAVVPAAALHLLPLLQPASNTAPTQVLPRVLA
ncbi:hypothetical protein Pcinc_003516 [Petrolisthes cinctipes]|uniref:Uncharacterized protein n=1 Tax=Petrolisthes cinctipes TaxID=88211 RepID=A0AAE1L2F0_PETCI|nr:hypothetical protein Pcinc_003516 [Petrolisthes cinctipes]